MDAVETRHQWPAGHRAALVVVIRVDSPSFTGTESSVEPRHIGADYAATGLQRLLTNLDDLDVAATTAWSAEAVNTLPQLIRRTAERGHEIAVSLDQSTALGSSLDELVATGKRLANRPVAGVVHPLITDAPHSSATAQADIANPDIRWQMGGSGGDVPSVTRRDGQQAPLVTLPTSPYWIDATWLNPAAPQPPSSLLEAWSTGLSAIRAEGGLMTTIIHPHIAGRPGIASMIVRFLDEAIASGDVWITRADQVAAWWLDQHQTQQITE